MTHTDIIGRLAAATGPDRELDDRIWAEMDERDVREHNGRLLAKSRRAPFDECVIGGGTPTPAYSSSIDATVALIERVLPGWEWQIGKYKGDMGQACLRRPDADEPERLEFAPTPPLAACLALFRALEAREAV